MPFGFAKNKFSVNEGEYSGGRRAGLFSRLAPTKRAERENRAARPGCVLPHDGEVPRLRRLRNLFGDVPSPDGLG
jgi:hypothetical protein